MRRDTLLPIAAVAGAVVLGVWAWRSFRAPRPDPAASRAAALEAAIANVEAGQATTPILGAPERDGSQAVTFLARRDGGKAPRVVSDITGWGEHVDGTFDFGVGRMTRVGLTDWYSLEARVARGARVEYLLAYAPTDYRLDPRNPRQSAGRRLGGAPASEFVAAGYVPPAAFTEPPPSVRGTTTEAVIPSRTLGGSARVVVYTPAGYRRDGDYGVAVFLDARSGPLSRTLDWMIARQAIEPVVAVFVDPATRGRDTGASGAWAPAFVTGDLLAWLTPRYAVARRADRRAVIAVSFGGKDALFAALGAGDSLAADPAPARGSGQPAFDRLGLLIPGRRIGRADIDAVAARRGRSARVAILAGRYDQANVPTARALRDALARAGHLVGYTEVPEGHNPSTYLNHVDVVLAGLFPPTPAAATIPR